MRKIAVFLCFVAAAGSFGYAFYFQFANPELTQTQLLIANWPYYAVFAGAMAAAFAIKPK